LKGNGALLKSGDAEHLESVTSRALSRNSSSVSEIRHQFAKGVSWLKLRSVDTKYWPSLESDYRLLRPERLGQRAIPRRTEEEHAKLSRLALQAMISQHPLVVRMLTAIKFEGC
jgi:hypothetical protein